MSINGTIGNIALYNGENVILGKSAAYININTKASRSFIFYVLQTYYISHYYENELTGTTIRNLSIKSVKNTPILLPPLPEQQKIATILTTVNDKIENIDLQIAEYTNLKKGLMQRLLTIGIGHTKFKDSVLGVMPEEWEVVKLGSVTKSYAGGTPKRGVSKYYDNANIPWIKSGELNQNEIIEVEEYISEVAVKETAAKYIIKDTVLIALYGATAGQVSISRLEKATTNQAVLSVFPIDTNNLCNEFLYQFLKFNKDKILNLCQGSGQPNLSKQIIDNYYIALPEYSEQRKIADILISIDDKLEFLQNKKVEYINLKKGLMDKLLTGKIRVKING
jgi:type I restriction enzyme, S subunit